jgi:uncharacterized phage-like protein YoqJ
VTVTSITGHRPQSIDRDFSYSTAVWDWIRGELAAAYDLFNVDTVITGMALGVDTVAAQVAERLHIPFIAAVPFAGQESRWAQPSKDEYIRLLSVANDRVHVCKPGYAPWKMQRRNEYMVNNGDFVIAVWNGDSGGTGNCVRYAIEQEKPVWRINPKTREVNWFGDKTLSV